MKTLENPGNLHVAFLLCLISPCLSSNVYKYFTTQERDRLVEALFDENKGYADCAVFGDRNVVGNILKDVPADKIDEISKSDLDLYIEKCHEFHLTLDDSPLRRKRFVIYPDKGSINDLSLFVNVVFTRTYQVKQDSATTSTSTKVGTKWCGAGNISSNNSELGVYNDTDACCRQHDHCPDYILPFTSKYGLFNSAPYTRSDCACDEEFYRCLKASPDDAGVRVGKIFFNLLSMKCVGYGHPLKCVERGWLYCLMYEEDTSKIVRKFTSNARF